MNAEPLPTEMPARPLWTHLRLGLFVLGAGALFATAVALFAGFDLFQPKYRLRLYAANVEGLSTGAPVHIDGLEVGRVEAIRFGARSSDGKPDRSRNFEVIVKIQRRHQREIRTDSAVRFAPRSVFGGVGVEITRGSAGAVVPPNGELLVREEPRFDLRELIEKVSEAVKCLAEEAAKKKK